MQGLTLLGLAHSILIATGVGVDPIELTHAPGESRLQSLYHQVRVVGHQAVGITPPVHPPADLTEEIEACLAVLSVQVYDRTAMAIRGDLIDRARKLSSQWSRHGGKDTAGM